MAGPVADLLHQLIYVPSRPWKLAFLITATSEACLFGYLLAFTAPPLAAILLLLATFGPLFVALVWLSRLAGRRTIWEVTDTHFRQIARGKVAFKTALRDIGSITASGGRGATSSVIIKDLSGRVVGHLVSGPQLTHEDLRFLYGAIMGRLAWPTEIASQTSDWPATPPTSEKRWAGRRPGLWGEHHTQLFVASPVIMTALGALFAVIGLLRESLPLLFLGIALSVAGAALLALAYRYLERRTDEGRLEF